MADHGIEYEITTLEAAHKHIHTLEEEIAEARGFSEGRRKAVVRIYEALGVSPNSHISEALNAIKELKRERDAWKQCHDDHCAMTCDFDPKKGS